MLFLFLFIFQRLLGEMSIEEPDEGAKGDDDNTHHHVDDAPCRGSLPGLVHDLLLLLLLLLFLLLFFTILLFLC